MLAEALARMMTGDMPDKAPVWHLPFLYHWRAEHLGPEAAAGDRERAVARGDAWVDDFWKADGTLCSVWVMDAALVRWLRKEWREDAGLPEGVP